MKTTNDLINKIKAALLHAGIDPEHADIHVIGGAPISSKDDDLEFLENFDLETATATDLRRFRAIRGGQLKRVTHLIEAAVEAKDDGVEFPANSLGVSTITLPESVVREMAHIASGYHEAVLQSLDREINKRSTFSHN